MIIDISSRTPEGWPTQCPTCGANVTLRFSDAGDATCSACGLLVWIGDAVRVWVSRVPEVVASQLSVEPPSTERERQQLLREMAELQMDSLDVVELAMEFEDAFGITILDDEYDKIRTIDDLLLWVENRYPRTRPEQNLESE